MKAPNQTLDDVLRESDQNMYQEKAGYYQKTGTNRRGHPDA